MGSFRETPGIAETCSGKQAMVLGTAKSVGTLMSTVSWNKMNNTYREHKQISNKALLTRMGRSNSPPSTSWKG